jgi:hypothetical protein
MAWGQQPPDRTFAIYCGKGNNVQMGLFWAGCCAGAKPGSFCFYFGEWQAGTPEFEANYAAD